MNYWLHRCEKHEGGLSVLENEHRLTIGFSDCAKDVEMAKAIFAKDGVAFDVAYQNVYGGEIMRARYSLWRFACEFAEGDVVVVPWAGGFSICQLKGKLILSERRTKTDLDIGFEWDVEILAVCSPREAYATTRLLSRMKCRQTTLDIRDLEDDVKCAIDRCKARRPYSLSSDLAKKCHDLLAMQGSPDQFEQLLCNYFTRLGGEAEVFAKNYAGKVGDCDVSAVFPALRLTISAQVKKHEGETGDWAVQQIADYEANRKAKVEDDEKPSDWTYVNWVVSLGSDFSEKARDLANAHGIVLINGDQFCQMLVSVGIGFAVE